MDWPGLLSSKVSFYLKEVEQLYIDGLKYEIEETLTTSLFFFLFVSYLFF